MKNWAHLPHFHVSFLSYGPSIVKKSAFFLSLLKEFTYMHQKVLIILFEKMISFIGV